MLFILKIENFSLKKSKIIFFIAVTLGGIKAIQFPHKFVGFSLAAERDLNDLRDYSMQQITQQQNFNVGVFQLFGDALTKFSEKCENVVTHTSSMPKTEIQVSDRN